MRSYGLGMAGLVVIANLTLLGQGEIWFGTWKLNPAKSAYVTDPSPPPGQHTITRVEPWEGGLMYRTETVTTRGEVRHTEWTARFDGKDYPVKGVPTVDSYALKRVDDHTYEVIAKKDGKITTVSRSVISADGRSRVVTQSGQHADGKKVSNVLFFDRQ